MKLSKRNLNNDQPKTLSKRDDKKSVNINWNSKLFFQLSLIISLLVVYSVMQTKFETRGKASVVPKINYLEEPPIIIYTLEEPQKLQKKKVVNKQLKIKTKVLDKVIKVGDGSVSETDTSNFNKNNDKDIPENKIPIKVKQIENKIINVLGVEHVPVFPGCESVASNIGKRDCMSLKIKAFIQKKFNADKFYDQNIRGEQTISVQFYIDENGNVSEVKARATERALEKEAIRVVSRLPQMKPGKQGDKVVKVQYMVPIVFKIE